MRPGRAWQSSRSHFLFWDIIPARAPAHRKECRPTEVVVNTLGKTVALIAVAGCCIAFSVAPASRAGVSPDRTAFGQTTQVESVTGRITAVTGNTFTVETTSPSKTGDKAVVVTVDQDTMVHGRIAVGLVADVTFRREDQNNIAVSVRTSRA